MNLKMIVCVSENYAIGNKGDLLFSLPPDMKFFRETTLNKTVIMGRATLDSFPGGKPLKNRTNIVLSRDNDFEREGVLVFNSPEKVLDFVRECDEETFVIGGAQIYKMFEPYCREALVTKVQKTAQADKFFFDIDSSPNWRLASESPVMEYEGLKFTFCKYLRD